MKATMMDALGEKLREEGRAMGPGFSPALHERVVGALRAAEMKEIAPFEERRSVIWRIGVPLGIAAAVAIAAGTWAVVRKAEMPVGPRVQVANGTNQGNAGTGAQENPTAEAELQELAKNPANITGDEGQYAYLDRDAERFVSFVADQVPSFPAGAQ